MHQRKTSFKQLKPDEVVIMDDEVPMDEICGQRQQ